MATKIGNKIFTEKGQEKTFYRFTVIPEGEITDFGFGETKFIKPWSGAQPTTEPMGGTADYESGDLVPQGQIERNGG